MKFHLLIIVCALCDCNVVNGQSPEDEVCQSIIDYVSSNSNSDSDPMCEALGDCTGVSCQSATLNNLTATIIVSKCTDPLEVNITVNNGFGDQILSEIVTNEGNLISDSGYRVDMFTRDEFAVNISVVYNADNTTLVPIIEIPLNASDCMCKAIKHIGENTESPFENECQVNSDCTGQECTFDVAGTIYLLESDVFPCAKPPGFVFIVRDSISKVALTEFFFNEDKNVSLFGLYPFHVTVEQRNYSIIVHGVLYYNDQGHQLIPETQIILDQTKCNVQTTMPTASPVPNEGISPQTCQSLKDIRDNTTLSGLTTCTVNDICDTVECLSFSEYDSSIQVLPCRDPPAIHFTLLYDGEEIFNKILTNSTNITVTDVIVLIVGISQKDNAIGFELDVVLGFQSVPIISEHDIIIDNCYCSDVYCSSSMPTPTNTAGSSVNLSVAVGVPVAVILIAFLVLIVIAIVIGVLVWKKKAGSYNKHEDDTAMSIKDNEIDGSIAEKM